MANLDSAYQRAEDQAAQNTRIGGSTFDTLSVVIIIAMLVLIAYFYFQNR